MPPTACPGPARPGRVIKESIEKCAKYCTLFVPIAGSTNLWAPTVGAENGGASMAARHRCSVAAALSAGTEKNLRAKGDKNIMVFSIYSFLLKVKRIYEKNKL